MCSCVQKCSEVVGLAGRTRFSFSRNPIRRWIFWKNGEAGTRKMVFLPKVISFLRKRVFHWKRMGFQITYKKSHSTQWKDCPDDRTEKAVANQCSNDTKQFIIDIPCRLAERVEKYAKERGDTITGVMIDALDAFMMDLKNRNDWQLLYVFSRLPLNWSKLFMFVLIAVNDV